MEDALRDGLTTVAEFVPKLVLFLLIPFLGIVAALNQVGVATGHPGSTTGYQGETSGDGTRQF